MEGIEVRRRLRQPREERRLAERELRRRLREVRLSGGLDPVRVVAVVDLVLVRVQDLLLRPALAQLDREAGLLELALDRPLPRDVEVAHELLGDRRAALDDLAVPHVLPESAHNALRVDAAVTVETSV